MLAGRRARRLDAASALAMLLLTIVASPARSVLVFDAPGFTQEVAVGGLPFATAIAFGPDGRLFVALKSGVVRMVRNGALRSTPFIDLSPIVNDRHDRGLLGIAVHPAFPSVPYVYLLYTHDPPGAWGDEEGARVAQLMRVEADPARDWEVARTTSGSRVVLLGTNSTLGWIGNVDDGRDVSRASCMTGLTMSGTPVRDCIPSDEISHTIGTVAFAPDGSLFVSVGDGASYAEVDPRALRAQLLDSLAGKILRIDPITGRGLPDNPFYQSADPTSNRSRVWASGLRNPFRLAVRPSDGDAYVGDVGWNSWEEIDGGKGANFGWPCYEGGVVPGGGHEGGNTTSRRQSGYESNTATRSSCSALYALGLSAVRRPVYAYDHDPFGTGDDVGASANAGAFYAGGVYPSQYRDALFIADYNRRWIRTLRFDTAGNATVQPFATETDESIGPVQLAIGPDTNLYVVMYRGSGSEIRRIRYTGGGNTPPTAVAEATPTTGAAPLAVAFSSRQSFDPDAQPLVASWNLGDGSFANVANPVHTYQQPGVYDARLTVWETTSPFASSSATVRITVGTEPPFTTIHAPADGARYRIGQRIDYSGSAVAGGASLPAGALSWETRLHHNEHIHYDLLGTGTSGSFVVGEHGDDTWTELCLTAEASGGLSDTRCVELRPLVTTVTVGSQPPGAAIVYEDEGVSLPTPAQIFPIVGSVQTLTAPAVQQSRSFDGWTDGTTARSRTFTAGSTALWFTARYANRAPTASFTATPARGTKPLDVRFDGAASSDPEGDALVHRWSFGDGTSAIGRTVTHRYPDAGSYTAALTVTDTLGASHASAVAIHVTASSCGLTGAEPLALVALVASWRIRARRRRATSPGP